MLIALASNFTISEHRTNPNSTYNEQVMNRFHEVNGLYDVNLNEIHHFMYATDIAISKCKPRKETWNYRTAVGM